MAPEAGVRLTCMCEDCQTYAHWLGRAGDMLDRWGGTDVFQMTPAQVEIGGGRERLRCIRQSKRGAQRWYAGCCKTPVGNSLGPKLPFLGLHHLFMDHDGDGRPRDEVLGPILARCNARWAQGDPPPDAYDRAPLWVTGRSAWVLLKGWARGARRPSPFHGERGRPIAELEQMSLEERNRLRAIVRGVADRT